jgi:hypothetical protein
MLMRAAKDLRLALGAGATSAMYGEDCASTDRLIFTEPISRSLRVSFQKDNSDQTQRNFRAKYNSVGRVPVVLEGAQAVPHHLQLHDLVLVVLQTKQVRIGQNRI